MFTPVPQLLPEKPLLKCVLLFGHDDELLRTPWLVLQRAGYRVVGTTNIEEIDLISAVEPIGVVLLCYTLSLEEQEAAVTEVQRYHPNVPSARLLPLEPSTCKCAASSQSMTHSALQGAGALVRLVNQLLAARAVTKGLSRRPDRRRMH